MRRRNKKHLLIVEDSPDIQFLLAQLFEGEGYRITRAFDGKQALDLLLAMNELPSLILLDVMMPVMSGIEFRIEQAKIPELAAIPVIVMSADVNAQAMVKQLGISEFIRKPIRDIDQLLEMVEQNQSK